jgi:hypothetical protein
MTTLPFPDRDAVAAKLTGFTEADQSFIKLLMENAAQDDNLLAGLLLWLDQAADARILNSLKLAKIGEWLGANAPARLQIRLSETSKSSQHPAYRAFRDGIERSGGLEKAYPQV